MKEGLSRNTDPVSSHMAGRDAVRINLTGKHRDRILSVLTEHPMTNMQIARLTGLNQNQVTRRMTELERQKKAERGELRQCPYLGRIVGTWKLRR